MQSASVAPRFANAGAAGDRMEETSAERGAIAQFLYPLAAPNLINGAWSFFNGVQSLINGAKSLINGV